MPVSIVDDDVFAALAAFILNILPALGEANVLQGPLNDVPMPPGPNFVLMVPSDRAGLATTVRDYRPDDGQRDTTRSTQVGCTVNFYGPDATDNGQIFNQLFRDLYGVDFMRPYHVAPLWCDDGRQMPLIDSEKQYAVRWMIRAVMQINPTVSTSQEFADTVAVTFVEADKW